MNQSDKVTCLYCGKSNLLGYMKDSESCWDCTTKTEKRKQCSECDEYIYSHSWRSNPYRSGVCCSCRRKKPDLYCDFCDNDKKDGKCPSCDATYKCKRCNKDANLRKEHNYMHLIGAVCNQCKKEIKQERAEKERKEKEKAEEDKKKEYEAIRKEQQRDKEERMREAELAKDFEVLFRAESDRNARKQLYRRLAKKYHPDKGIEKDATVMQRLNDVYNKYACEL